VGNSCIVLLSTDGGETWITKSNGIVNELMSVKFTNLTTVWIAASNGEVMYTTDLGDNWAFFNDLTNNNLSTLFFTDENTGWVGGNNGTIFKYQNDILPVELISFTADVTDGKVKLQWQTGTEVNNSGFEIERKSNQEEWTRLGFVEGKGNSTSIKSYFFTDMSLVGGSKFQYRLKQLDYDGKYKYSNEIEVEIVPNQFALYQNYPNPFNPITKIRYILPKESQVVIKIYDVLGSEVTTLLNEKKEPGVYEVELNAQSLASGAYIYRIVAGQFVETKKLVLMK
jgi:hypothetical protein